MDLRGKKRLSKLHGVYCLCSSSNPRGHSSNSNEIRIKVKVWIDFWWQYFCSHQVILGAIFDLLLCQGDRHDENIFIDEFGHLTLIDNDEAFKRSWRPVGVDSILLPLTQSHKARHVGMYIHYHGIMYDSCLHFLRSNCPPMLLLPHYQQLKILLN